MVTFLKGAVEVFIARENAVGATYTSTAANHDSSALLEAAVRALAGSTGGSSATRVLFKIPGVTGVSIGSFGNEFDTYQTVDNAFDHDIEIKNTGSGSCDFVFEYGRTTGAAGIAHEELKALAYYLPNGWNEANPSESPFFNAAKDMSTARGSGVGTGTVTDGVAKTDDQRGYCIIVAQAVGDGNNLYWCFDNCKISCSVSFASKQASRGTLTWDDARYVSFDEHADELVAGTDVHNDGQSKGFA